MGNLMDDPRDWKIPAWHGDYGDIGTELEMLKGFCLALQKLKPNRYLFHLDSFEEGYLCARVMAARDLEFGELHIVEGRDQKRYGLFLHDGQELYFQEINEGLRHF